MATMRRSVVELGLLVLAVWAATQWWTGHRDDRDATALAAAARPGDIVMLSSASCVYCERARHWLTANRVPFSECFIEADAACAARYQQAGAAGTPTLLVRGQRQLGFNANAVAQALRAAPS